MFAVQLAAHADLPGSALPAWLTLAAGAIALIVLAARSWFRNPRTRATALAGIIPIAGAMVIGGFYLATETSPTPDESPVPLSEDVDIQLPTLSFTI